MADISKITLPNGSEYNIKDATARSQSGVTGVKGNSESSYRTGQVNLTATNVGAVDKSGDTMTGTLTLVGSRYTDDNATAALKLQNSNIIGVNSIYTADASDNAAEGIHFYRDATHFDSLYAKSGNLYFTPNRALGTAGTDLAVLREDSLVSEANLKWGGKNFSASYGCIDAAMIGALGANRLEFSRAAGIDIEYSRDGGATWVDYGSTDSAKTALLSSVGSSHTIGKYPGSGTLGDVTTDCKLRDTLTTNKRGTYTTLNKFALYVTTYGATGSYVTITARTKANLDAGNETWKTIAENVGIAGWSGWNVINYPTGITTYGNSNGQYANIRFEFGITGTNPSYSSALAINNILGFGGVGWSVPSYMAKNGHLYSYNASQAAFFPSDVNPSNNNVSYLGTSSYKWKAVYATSFLGELTGNVIGGIRQSTIRPTSANRSATQTANLTHYLATSSMTTGKPMSDGHIIDMDWDNTGGWASQLFVPTERNNNTRHIQWRGQAGGTWQDWATVFDDTSTIPVVNGGTGATTAANALSNLGALPTAGGSMTGTLSWSDSTALPAITSPQYLLAIEPFASGGTTKYVTAANAWTALGGGAIGKKASLAASDIPNLSTDKLTSGTLGVARGGTGKATHTSNAVLTGNGTSAVNNVATASGALYATAANGAPSFGTLPIAQGGTGKTSAADARSALGVPPTSHAATGTTYGKGTDSNYGHLKLSAATDSTSGTSGGIAATPSAVKTAYDLANTANGRADEALSAARGGIVFDTTYTISGTTATFTAHVYSCGAEVTDDYAATSFTWYYRLGTTASTVSLGTGKTKAVTITTLGYGGSVGCTFDDGN